MRRTFWHKLIERVDRLDPVSVQGLVERLVSSHGLLETVFQALREGVLVLDAEGRVTYCNPAACRLLGQPEGGLEGCEAAEVLPDIDWKGWLAAAMPDGTDGAGAPQAAARELEVAVEGGVGRHLALYALPLGGGGGGEAAMPPTARAVAILRDVTGERANTAERVESERFNALLLLSAELAHEIGNPLNAIGIHLQLLGREIRHLPEADRAPLAELLDVATSETKRLEGILTQFLRAIRSSAPAFAKVALPEVVKETLTTLAAEIRDRRIAVDLAEPPEDLPRAWLDRLQAGQACFNVIRNAIQAMQDGGVLRIIFTASERFVSVAFLDTGGGIPPERMNHLFEPFQSSKANGTGLGLLVVQRILRDHGGSVDVDSLRSGTRIQLNFRREDARMRLLAAPGKEEDGGTDGAAAPSAGGE